MPSADLVAASNSLYGQGQMILDAILATTSVKGFQPVTSRAHQLETLKLTLVNGQTRSIDLNKTERSFVTGFQTSVDRLGHVAGRPVISSIQTGLSMTVHAEISEDRRYVALTIDLTKRTIASPVPRSRIETPLGPQTIERPQVATSHVLSTVIVPDGGTVLLGGTTTVNEGRSGANSHADHSDLQIMVTPRIIILEDSGDQSSLQVSVEVSVEQYLLSCASTEPGPGQCEGLTANPNSWFP